MSARSVPFGSLVSPGAGTAAPSGSAWPGLVPQVTYGVSVVASIVTSWSKTAPSSVGSDFQYSTAASQSAPRGACGRPLRYSNVVSSGAMSPARAPASMDMLQTVRRPSMDSDLIASPRYSTM